MRQIISPVNIRGSSWKAAGTVLYILLVLGPVLALLVQSGKFLAGDDAVEIAVRLLIPTGRRQVLLIRTLLYALSVALTCIVIGGFAASQLWQWRGARLRVLRWLLLILAPLPPYIHGLAWSSLVMGINRFLRESGLVELLFRGWFASWWVESMALLPITTGMALIGFLLIDRELLDSARLQGSDGSWLCRIVLPLSAPTLIAGGGVVFILSLVDYSVPSLFQMNVYSLEIFAEFSATSEPVRAFLLGVPLWIIAVFVLGIAVILNGPESFSPGGEDNLPPGPLVLPRWMRIAQRAGLILLVCHVLIPLVSQLILVRSASALFLSVAAAKHEIGITLWIALGAALLSLPLIYAAAQKLLISRRPVLHWGLILVPITLPASLVGIGLVTLWNSLLHSDLYGTLWMPVFAGAARFLPFGVLAAAAQMSTVQQDLIESARIYQRSTLQRILRIDLPLYAPGLIAAAALIFILTIGELGAVLIVAPPGQGTLTMRIYNYLHYGATDTVAGLCLAITMITLLFGVSAVFLLRRFFYSRSLG